MDNAGRENPDERGMMRFSERNGGEADVDFETTPGARSPSGLQASIAVSASPSWLARIRPVLAAAMREEGERGTLFLFIPVLLALGAGIYLALPIEPAWIVLLPVAFASALVLLAGRRRTVPRLLSAGCLVVFLGATAAKLEAWRADTPMLGATVSSVVTGRIIATERRPDGRIRLTLDILATERPHLRYAPDRIRVTTRTVPEAAAPGAVVSAVVRLFPPSGPARPDGYDFSFESYMDGRGATGFVMGDVRLVDMEDATTGRMERLAARIATMRQTLADRVSGRIGGAEGEIAAALVAGTRGGIPEEVNEALRKTGLAHVLSISGLHMALVAGTVIFGLRAAFAFAPGFASRHPVRKYAAIAGLAAAACYLLISGAAVAAQRSFIMIAVMLVALLFDRAALTMRNLAIAAIIVIAIAPHEVVGPSFQMSFAATAALIAFYGWWSERSARRWAQGAPTERSLPSRLARGIVFYGAGIAATSLVAGAATALYGVWHFHRLAPLGLLANLAAMPIVSAVVMPSAVVAGLLIPFGLEGPALDVMGRGIAIVIGIAQWLAARSPLDAVGAISGASVLTLTAALVLLTLPATRLRLSALPVAAAGMVLLLTGERPAVLISEDARLVAVRLEDGRLAVNRTRPNGFVTGIWMDAAMATSLKKPEHADMVAPAGLGGPQGFVCDDTLCLLRHESGAVVAWAEDGAAGRRACAMASVLVIDDATVANPCGGGVLILTKRDLARRGSAEIRLGEGDKPRVRFSIAEPYRPWHGHRQYSREARGLAPWRRDKQ
ncbi:ComEC/Rec2 family competence protein [Mesorhizobium xinjiangense]|uniref:ComEC/Rec2 family competence protein n=1 Tax=Mesorhizobium xinjiangense TaxID=2678685 RepID=UPI0012EDEFB5|nr:ComEC/Rec2 family competence protein [Mesorhizobium xinjiangense]